MVSRTQKEVVISAKTKGFAQAQQEAARIARDNAKAIDAQVKGFASTGKAMGEVEKETKRLEGVLQGLAKRQVAINRLMEQTPDKASKAWKELQQELKKTDQEAQRVQRTISTMDRAFARQREQRQGFAQGLLQGAAPGAMTFLQRGPGMRMQAAGAAIGGVGRQLVGAGAAGISGGLLQGPQGLISAMGQIPFVGGLLAAPLQRQLQQAQQGMQFVQQRQAQLPFLGGLEMRARVQGAQRRAERRAGVTRPEIERAAEEARDVARFAEIRPEFQERVQDQADRERQDYVERRAREDRERYGFEGRGASNRRIARENYEKEFLRGKGGEEGLQVAMDSRARQLQGEEAAKRVREEGNKERREARAAAGARTRQRALGIGTGTQFGMDLNEELQIRGAVQQVGGGVGITGQERQMGTTAMAAQRAFGISPQVAGAFLQAGRRGGLVGLDATTGERGAGGVPKSFLAAQRAQAKQAEEEQAPELQTILEQPQEQARRQVMTFEPRVITARRQQAQADAEKVMEPTEAPRLQEMQQAAVSPVGGRVEATKIGKADFSSDEIMALETAYAERQRQRLPASQMGREAARDVTGPAMAVLEPPEERVDFATRLRQGMERAERRQLAQAEATEEPELQKTKAQELARTGIDKVFGQILEKAGIVEEKPAEVPRAEMRMAAAPEALPEKLTTEKLPGIAGTEGMPGPEGAAARTGGRQARGPADALTKAMTDAMKLGLQGSEINDYLQQMAAGISQWRSTGIPVNADSAKAIGDAVSEMGIGGVRGMAIAGGVGRAAENIAETGPQSVGQLMMLRALGGLGKGGTGSPMERMEDALIRMEKKDFGKEEFAQLIKNLLRAGGGGVEGRRVAHGVLRGAGIKVSREEMKEMAAGASPERIEEIRRQRMTGEQAAEKLDTPAKLAAAASQITSQALKDQAKMSNDQIRNGTKLLGGMKNLEQAAQNMTNEFTKVFAPLLARLGEGFENLSETLTETRGTAMASYPEQEVSQ